MAEGKIVFVGSDGDAARWIGPQTRVIELQGRMVLPGFHDAHVHPMGGGMKMVECDLTDLSTREKVVEKIRQYAKAHPELPWIRGGGWELPLFSEANPHKSLLDEIVPDRPVYLRAMDGHSAWVNSRALAIAKITKETPDPEHGRIERDSRGEPSGTLREEAMELVGTHLPQRTPNDYLDGLRRGLALARQFGITSIQDAGADENTLARYAELDRRGELNMHVVAAVVVDPQGGEAEVRRAVELRRKYPIARTVKIYLDGVIEARTAAVIEPYVDRGGRGTANAEPEELNRFVAAVDREGFQIHVHAIGDRAVRMMLDAIEYAQKKNGRRDARHHISHLQLIHPDDIPRFRALGVVANFQPLWAYADTYITELTIPGLGEERSRWLYPIGSVVQSGALVAAGSDWPVTSMNPLEAIQVVVTRRGERAEPGPAWIPEELVDLPTALAMYTTHGAYVNFQERETGSIEVGKSGDLVILSRNLAETPSHQIHAVKAVLTILEGREVCRDSGFADR